MLENISYIALRQGFEVCGILEDVYLAKKRNVYGGVFGFVRFGKVLNVEKLLKALNNVWFGDYRVVAKVASFDRFGNRKNDVRVKDEVVNFKGGRDINVVRDNFMVQERGVGTEDAGCGKAEVEVAVENEGREGFSRAVRKGLYEVKKYNQIFVPKYTSLDSDMSWVAKGVVVSVLNGDAIPVLQRRIFDAGFVNLVIIPMGADKVFLRSLDDVDVSTTLPGACEFFNNFFSQPVRWNKDTLVRERGAWVRIYGVPLHAWNYEFFKLCVYDSGRLLKIDDITLDRDRFDYARVLVATSSLEIIKAEANIMVDGVLFEFKIVEEWGFAVGEDACLFDEAESQADDRSVPPDDLDNDVGGGEVDGLLNSLADDRKKEDNVRRFTPPSASATVKVTTASPIHATSPPTEDPSSASASESKTEQVLERVSKIDRQDRQRLTDDKLVARRASSCPPRKESVAPSGPWRLEWANTHKSFSMGYASKPKLRVSARTTVGKRVTKKKGGGYLRHCALNLKRIARLSDCDRREVLRAFRRTSRKRKPAPGTSKAKVTSKSGSPNCTSQTSVNKDWNNWLVLHGNDKVRSDDVSEIGRSIGLNFAGDKNNMFDVLSRVGRQSRVSGGVDA